MEPPSYPLKGGRPNRGNGSWVSIVYKCNLVFLSFLTVISVWPMLAHIVLLDEQWIHGQVRIDAEGDEGHFGTLLHDLGVIYGIVGRGTP